MALSNAALLANIASGDALTVDNTNDRVGIASTLPTSTLDVVGIVSATAFYGDGSNLDGVASAGLGTAISETVPGDVIYYTNTVLSIGATITVDAPSSSNVAYTQYSEIAVQENIDLIIADGDDFIPDILGLSTEGVTPLVGAGGRIRADNFTNKAGTGAPTFPAGVVVTGVATATTFSGNATGLTGTPDITVRNIIGVGATLSGVLTYEDVTNIDSIGIVTARTGIKVLAGGANIVGVTTAASGTDLQGYKVEEGSTAATSLNGEFDFLLDNGHVQRYSAATGGNYFPDIKVSGSKSLDSIMGVGDVVSVMLLVASSSHYCTTGIKIDNSTSNLDIEWIGGSAPTAANGSGFDIYSFTIIKTAATPAYHIIGNTSAAA